MELALLNDRILDYLLDSNQIFKPRIKNNNNRLNDGQWFLGDGSYLAITFWNGYDHARKIPNICFQLYPGDLSFIRIVLSSKDDLSKVEVLKKISVNGYSNYENRPFEWFKDYRLESASINNIILALDNFINEEKVIIDRILLESNHLVLNNIDVVEYEGWISRILEIRRTNSDTIHNNQLVPKTIKKRKGVNFLNDKKYIKNQLAKTITVEQIHKKIQNNLKNEFDNFDKVISAELEKNYIDLLVDYENYILIIELKIDKSPSVCIRKGIGQLISYYYKSKNNLKKDVCLCIAGPNKLSKDDDRFLTFIKNMISVDFKYFSIDGMKFY